MSWLVDLWRSFLKRSSKDGGGFVVHCASCRQAIEDTEGAIVVEIEEDEDGIPTVVACCCELCLRRVQKRGCDLEELDRCGL
jgi:hypothetical protein